MRVPISVLCGKLYNHRMLEAEGELRSTHCQLIHNDNYEQQHQHRLQIGMIHSTESRNVIQYYSAIVAISGLLELPI